MTTYQQFQTTIAANPELTTHGFGVDKGWNDSFPVERSNIHDCFGEYEICLLYLAAQNRLDKKATSYWLKHQVEHWARENGLIPDYIREGAFVAAVIAMNLPYKRVKNSTHILLK